MMPFRVIHGGVECKVVFFEDAKEEIEKARREGLEAGRLEAIYIRSRGAAPKVTCSCEHHGIGKPRWDCMCPVHGSTANRRVKDLSYDFTPDGMRDLVDAVKGIQAWIAGQST